jgi:hypothetical protein
MRASAYKSPKIGAESANPADKIALVQMIAGQRAVHLRGGDIGIFDEKTGGLRTPEEP